MAPAFRGEKFGEQLLKQCLWFAQSNGYDVVYLTAYADKDDLLHLLQAYGFRITTRQDNGELIVEKVMRKGPLPVDAQTDILDLDRASYPRFADGEGVAKYCVPIQGAYHEKLFPRDQLPRAAAAVLGTWDGARAHGDAAPGAHAGQHDPQGLPVPRPGQAPQSPATCCCSTCRRTSGWNGRRA